MLTKEDLRALAELIDDRLETRLQPIQDDIAGMKTEIVGMKEDIAGMKTEIAGMKEEISEVKRRTTRLEIIIENQMDKAVRILAEGHESILEKMDRDYVTQEQREKDRIRLFAVEETVKLHTEQISDLQKKTG